MNREREVWIALGAVFCLSVIACVIYFLLPQQESQVAVQPHRFELGVQVHSIATDEPGTCGNIITTYSDESGSPLYGVRFVRVYGAQTGTDRMSYTVVPLPLIEMYEWELEPCGGNER
jgi:hypothetical protein